MRHNEIASSILPASPANPGAKTRTTAGIKTSNSSTKITKKNTKTDMALEAKNIDFFCPSDTSFCENIGTNALVNAPSANRLLNKFGNLNETKKASDIAPAPSILASTISRKNPVMRLTKVKPPNVAIDLNKDIFVP